MSRLNYLEQYSSKNTVKSYKLALRDFFQVIYGDKENLESLAERYFTEQRNYEEDVQNFLVKIKDSPPKTVSLKLAIIRVFLVENKVELPQLFWRRLRGRIKGNRALTLDKIPSNVELRRMLTHMPIQGKALYLTLSSSGMRTGETLQLKLNDLELDQDPVKINIRGEYTKSGNPRISFISREAKEAVEEWLKTRNQYLDSAVKKSHLYKKEREDQRLFPFQSVTALQIWRRSLVKSQYLEKDPRTNRNTMHPHVMRKFFRTRMATLIPVDVAEALMGHEGYLTEVYRRYSVEDLAKFYKQGESSILIFTETGEVSKLKQEIDEKSKQLQDLVNNLSGENIQLRKDLSGLKELVETRLKDIDGYHKELEEQVQWFREGNVVIAYTGDKTKEELQRLILESIKQPN